MLKLLSSKVIVRVFSILMPVVLFTACESASSAGGSGSDSLPYAPPGKPPCATAHDPCTGPTPPTQMQETKRISLSRYQVERVYRALTYQVAEFPPAEEGCLGRCKATYLHPLNAQALSRTLRKELNLKYPAYEYENFLALYSHFFGATSGELMNLKKFGDFQ